MELKTLLPCAHCGSDNVHLIREVCTDGSIAWRIMCRDCGISTCGYPETGYDKRGELEKPSTPTDVNDVLVRMDDAIDTATTIWNSRANSSTKPSATCPSANLDLKGKSNDELVSIVKECQDILATKACHLLEEIKRVMEEDE